MAKWTIPDDAPIFGHKPKEALTISVGITLGNGNEFGIDKDDEMFIGRISEPASRVYLGKATVQNFRRFIGNMERLQIHMTHEGKDDHG